LSTTTTYNISYLGPSTDDAHEIGLSDPDVSVLMAAGFERPASRMKVAGLELLGSERIGRRD